MQVFFRDECSEGVWRENEELEEGVGEEIGGSGDSSSSSSSEGGTRVASGVQSVDVEAGRDGLTNVPVSVNTGGEEHVQSSGIFSRSTSPRSGAMRRTVD